jgi:hypothetical protein
MNSNHMEILGKFNKDIEILKRKSDWTSGNENLCKSNKNLIKSLYNRLYQMENRCQDLKTKQI